MNAQKPLTLMLALSLVGGTIFAVSFANAVPSVWMLPLVFYAGAVATFFAVIAYTLFGYLSAQKRS